MNDIVHTVISYESSYTRTEISSSLMTFAKSDISGHQNFPVVCFDCYKSDIGRIRSLEPIKYVATPRFESYCRILRMFDDIIQAPKDQRPMVQNLSVSYGPGLFSISEPINLATRAVANAGALVIMAVGNDGPGEHTLNPWSVAPWVIGVGAADEHGQSLWRYSSIGKPGSNAYHPTLVSHGIDVPTLDIAAEEPTKKHGSDVMLIISGMNLEEQGEEIGYVTGTSFATALVSRFVGHLMSFVEDFRFFYDKFMEHQAWHGLDTFYDMLRELDRRNLEIKLPSATPYVIKKMAEDAAVPMTGYDKHEVGSGFINEATIVRYLKTFSAEDYVRLCYSGEVQELMSDWLSAHQNPLMSEEIVDLRIKSHKENSKLINMPII